MSRQRDQRAGAGGARRRQAGTGAAGLAHDLNNVVAAIAAAANDILARPGLDAQTAQDVREIGRNAERGRALLRGFLGPAPATANRVLALDDLLAEVAPLIRRVLGVQIAFDIRGAAPGLLVRIDPTQFERIMTNLAANARDAMPAGGGVTVRLGHAAVEASAARDAPPAGGYATVEVADTGTGIEPDLLPRIFTPFVTTKQASGGLGLGLATVREIAGNAGGFLTIDSAVGRGTSIVLHLPLCHTRSESPARRTAACRTVLLVDDEDTIRRIAERSLRLDGWDVLAADSAEAALEVVERLGGGADRGLALLVSDVVLPGADGLALLAAIRSADPGLPAILVSGYAGEGLRADCAMLGASFLAKPYELKSLLSAARSLIGPVEAPARVAS